MCISNQYMWLFPLQHMVRLSFSHLNPSPHFSSSRNKDRIVIWVMACHMLNLSKTSTFISMIPLVYFFFCMLIFCLISFSLPFIYLEKGEVFPFLNNRSNTPPWNRKNWAEVRRSDFCSKSGLWPWKEALFCTFPLSCFAFLVCLHYKLPEAC